MKPNAKPGPFANIPKLMVINEGRCYSEDKPTKCLGQLSPVYSAAPELLIAVQLAEHVVRWAIEKGGENSGTGDMVLNTIRAAIKKAEGAL